MIDVTQREIEDLIIELLATNAGKEPPQLRSELEALGDDLPIDSVLAAEIVAIVQARCGVVLPATAETSRNLRSVRAFASAVWQLVETTTDIRRREGA